MEILFNNPLQSYVKNKKALDAAMKRVMASGSYILGEDGRAFEKEFAKYVGVKYAVGCASGTEAITIALLSLGKKGEVVTQANTCVPTVAGIAASECVPRLVDVDADNCVMDEKGVEKAINSRTCAVMPVHLYGRPNLTKRIVEACGRRKILLIEDCAQAHGAVWNGKKAGSIGAMGCFSFYPTKNLGCYGDGGAVTTDDRKLYETLLEVRNYGQKTRYHSDRFGINSRLDEIQAALLRAKLPLLDGWNKKRRELAAIYDRMIAAKEVKKLPFLPDSVPVYHLYVILCERRDELQEYLKKKGVHALIHYPVPVHGQKAYSHLGYRKGSFPVSEENAGRLLSLPLYPELSPRAVTYVAEQVNRFYGN